MLNYNGNPEDVMSAPKLFIPDGEGNPVKAPIMFKTQKPTLADGTAWDQTHDAARNMRYVKTLNLPEVTLRRTPRYGRCVIVGGAPSIKDHLDEIRALAADKNNAVFAINWAHTWLINNGIIPNATVFFEIDTEPVTVLKAAHPDCTYYICSHCDTRTFDALEGFKRIVYHMPPNSEPERVVHEELFQGSTLIGGGIFTLTRTIPLAMHLGWRHFDLFGCDSSYPDNTSTHVDGYETIMSDEKDGFFVYAHNEGSNATRRFRTIGPLALQAEEFKQICEFNHSQFSCMVHGDSLLRFMHEQLYPEQYL